MTWTEESDARRDGVRQLLRQRLVLIVVGALVILALVLGLVAIFTHIHANHGVSLELNSAIADQRARMVAASHTIRERQTVAAREALQVKCDSLARVLAGVAAVPLLTTDQASLDRSCAELMRDPDVVMAWLEAVPGGVRTQVTGPAACQLAGVSAEASSADVVQRLAKLPGLILSRATALHDGATVIEAVVAASDERLQREQVAISSDFLSLTAETDSGWSAVASSLDRAFNGALWVALGIFTVLAAAGTALTAGVVHRAIGRIATELDRLGAKVRALVSDLAGRNNDLEKALADGARNRALLDAVLLRMGEAVVVVNSLGAPILWNNRARNILDLRDEDTRDGASRLLKALCEADGITPVSVENSPIAQALGGVAVDDVVLRLPQAVGDRWLSTGARPLHHADGSLRGAVVVLHDITDLHRANVDLEHRVSERTRELEDVQRQLVTAARAAGMSEVATEVLHNVGNVLTSLNVTASFLAERIRLSAADRLAALAERAATDAAIQARLLDHLGTLAEVLAAERRDNLSDTVNLRAHLDHVAHIVRHQQGAAGALPLREWVDPATVVDDAVRIALAGIADPPAILRYFSAVGLVSTDRHRVLQIVINLLVNARRACVGFSAPRISITITLADLGAGPQLQIAITDSGSGIAPEHVSRLFDLGFTTRTDGHGVGLHASANAARLLGGRVIAASAGLGQGATFTLNIPSVA